MKTIIVAALLSLTLTGCGSFALFQKIKPIEIQTKPAERTPLNLPAPAPLSTKPVKWIVITPENMEEIWERIRVSGSDLVLFSITPEGYEQLSVDMLQIRQHIIKQNDVIVQYKKYYETPAEPVK